MTIIQWIRNNQIRYNFFKKIQQEIFYVCGKKNRRKRLRLDVHLSDNCNLNCSGCEHFSSLSVANYLNIDQYEKDCARLSYLTNGIVDDISLLGGEPLLNENIISIMKITRKYFHTGMIRIFTNGTLLLTQIDDFWRALNEYDIKLYISVYPIRLNHEKIREKASEFDVDIVYDGDVEHVTKTWRKMPIDISGNQNGRKSFAKCPVSNYCMQLVNGKIYPCFRIAYIPIFNKVFSQNLVVSDKDYIDIYKINNLKEILEFCRRPIPFCKYCNMKKIKIVKWAPTKKSISEWIEES